MIDVQSQHEQYGSFTALNQFSFQAREKEILGLLGPNGAGKTTAMRILTTYLYPSSGTAKVDGVDILKIRRKCAGGLDTSETAPLYADMEVDDYLRFVGESRGLGGAELAKRLRWVKEACQIEFIWKHLVSELSKGYKQRVGLAQALIHDPKVLILDEPTSGLDPLQIIGIRDLIRSLAKEKNNYFFYAYLSEVEAIADRIVIVNEGKLVAQGTLQELVQQTKGQIEKSNPSLEDIFIALLMPKKSRVKA